MCLNVIRKRVLISGDVQGVFFRETTRRLATESGVNGWIRNRTDGRVEAVFEGPADNVERLVAWTHRGPRGAAVTNVAVQDEQPEGLTGFDVS
jgi:acylphosphatase